MADDKAPKLMVHVHGMTELPRRDSASKSKTKDNNSISASKKIKQLNYLAPSIAGADASLGGAPQDFSHFEVTSKLSHFSKAISVGDKGHEKHDNEKQLVDLNKKFKWEEAREKVSKALKNAATPDGLVAINIKRLTFFSTDKIQRILAKATTADENLTMKRLQQMANDELKTKRTQNDGLGRRILAMENYTLPEINEEEEEYELDTEEIGMCTSRASGSRSTRLTPQLGSSGQRGQSSRRFLSSGDRNSLNERRSTTTAKTTVTSTSKSKGGTLRRRDDLDQLSLTSFKDYFPEKGWFEINPRIYFAIRTPLASKTTAVFVLPSNSQEDLIIDALVHFTCNINPLKDSVENIITISIVAFMPTDEAKHYIVAEKHFYLIDIIRSYCVADSYKFKSIHGYQLLAEADLEMCFGYGMFGYGYSNQLLNAGKPVTEGVARSIFIRADPGPETEKVKEIKGVESRIKGHAALAPQVTHPPYLDYRNRLEIHEASAICDKLDGSDRPSDAEVAASVRPAVVTLTDDENSRVRKMLETSSLSTWMNKFSTVTDRRERLVFLRSIVLNEPECFEIVNVKGLKPIDDEPSQTKDNMSKFNEIHNVKICQVKNMAGLKLKPERSV